jgi:DNA-binding protein
MDAKYILKIYTFVKTTGMKNLSLKMDDDIYLETERITSLIKKARNRYINEAVDLYNQFNRRKLLKKQLAKESALTAPDAMEALQEFEKIIDGR